MPILFYCTCGKKLQAKDELAGKRLKCPSCHKVQPVPASTAASVPLAGPVFADMGAGELPPLARIPDVPDEDHLPAPAPRFSAVSPPNPWMGVLDQQSTPWQGDDKERLNRGMAYREVPEFLVVFLILLVVGGLVAGAFYFGGAGEKPARTGKETQSRESGWVQGKVTYKGAPLPSGIVSFHSPNEQPYEEGILPDGSYQAVGLKPGPYKVTVITKEFKDIPPIKGPKGFPKGPKGPKGPPQFKGARDGLGQINTFAQGPPFKGPGKGGPPPKYTKPKFVPIPQRYADPSTSGLAVEIKVGKQKFNIDLTE